VTELFAQVGALPASGWAILVAAALLAGFSKTSPINPSMIVVALGALALPAKDSTATVLVMFLVADLVAIWTFRKHVDWRLIVRLILPVAAGLALGAVFLGMVDNQTLKRTIGAIVLVLTVLGLFRSRLRTDRRGVAYAYGALAGFTTMAANAGGPPMSLYLLAVRYDKWRFMGTQAWFFFAVNVVKAPITAGLGLLRPETAAYALVLAPVVLAGAWAGRALFNHIPQALFEVLVMVFAALTGIYLVLA
jgi:uncharacterized membrane protein YfcA